MKPSSLKRVCITPQPEHVGGPSSFVGRISAAMARRGIQVSHDLDGEGLQAVLLIGATRKLVGLRQARRKGARIVQRLDGINWLHHLRPTGPRHWIKAQLSNTLLAYTRDRIVDEVVYQSHFVQDWWRRFYGEGPPSRVIHNGVDLEHFHPGGEESPPRDHIRILVVEGRLGGGYELGLRHALALAGGLAAASGEPVELTIASQVEEREQVRHAAPQGVEIQWLGLVGQAELPALYHSAQMLFAADINPACPNSVIEALACGTPVVAFDTGALPELVSPAAGRLAPYGGDPWKLDEPDFEGLVAAGQQILAERSSLSAGARARAEDAFGLESMVDAYLEALAGG